MHSAPFRDYPARSPVLRCSAFRRGQLVSFPNVRIKLAHDRYKNGVMALYKHTFINSESGLPRIISIMAGSIGFGGSVGASTGNPVDEFSIPQRKRESMITTREVLQQDRGAEPYEAGEELIRSLVSLLAPSRSLSVFLGDIEYLGQPHEQRTDITFR